MNVSFKRALKEHACEKDKNTFSYAHTYAQSDLEIAIEELYVGIYNF